jgi:hypothetical protein
VSITGKAAIVAGLVTPVALAGCSSSGYSYVQHTSGSSDTFFKVPTTWKLFDQGSILKANPNIAPADVPAAEKAAWEVEFDGSTQPALNHVLAFAASSPWGVAMVRQLTPTEADSYSFASLRTELLPDDPLAAQQTGTFTYRVKSVSDITRTGGLRGQQMVVDVVAGQKMFRLDQVGLVDTATKHVFLLDVGCSLTCFQSNSGLINQVVSSWNVKEQ